MCRRDGVRIKSVYNVIIFISISIYHLNKKKSVKMSNRIFISFFLFVLQLSETCKFHKNQKSEMLTNSKLSSDVYKKKEEKLGNTKYAGERGREKKKNLFYWVSIECKHVL